MSLSISGNKLIMVVGHVGSGKVIVVQYVNLNIQINPLRIPILEFISERFNWRATSVQGEALTCWVNFIRESRKLDI